ncbi:hypothetical protein ABMA28_013891 [Loxostege sticticalis]|uniref:THAP-type domain-containing protein n=1 Tax=Loxostege sticticalis TaxID=481309 RepID=A0ABD0TJW6_LOXSC
MLSCVVKWCKNNTSSQKKCQGITFHRFPTGNEPWNDDWTRIIRNCRGQEDWSASKSSVVCSIHFEQNDLYTTSKGRRRLVTYATRIKLFIFTTVHICMYISFKTKNKQKRKLNVKKRKNSGRLSTFRRLPARAPGGSTCARVFADASVRSRKTSIRCPLISSPKLNRLKYFFNRLQKKRRFSIRPYIYFFYVCSPISLPFMNRSR